MRTLALLAGVLVVGVLWWWRRGWAQYRADEAVMAAAMECREDEWVW